MHHDRVRAVFDAATSLPASERELYLEAVGWREPRVADEVRELLEQDASPSLLDGGDQAFGLSPGQRFQGYEIIGQLGEGSTGEVYAAWQRFNLPHRKVALKLLRAGHAADEGPPNRLSEGDRLSLVNVAGAVAVYEEGQWQGCSFVVMEHVEGTDLGQEIERYHEDPEPAALHVLVRYMQRACHILADAHRVGVLHRDVKPSHVLIRPGGLNDSVRVIDWGLATRKGQPREDCDPSYPRGIDVDPGATFSLRGRIAGTPAYMAPEQARAEDIDERTDVYAAGSMLYHLLTGRAPFTDGAMTGLEVVERKRGGESPTRLAQLAPDAPAELIAVAERAMRADPDGRFRSMDAMAAELGAFLEDRIVPSHSSGAWTRFVKWNRRESSTSATVFTGLGIIAIVVVALLTSSNRTVTAALKDAEESAVDADSIALLFERIVNEASPETGSMQGMEVAELLEPVYQEIRNAPDLRQAPRLLMVLGAAYRALGDLDRARELFERARSEYVSREGSRSRGALRAELKLVGIEIDEGSWQEASAGLDRIDGSAGGREPDEILTQATIERARIRYLQGHLNGAWDLFRPVYRAVRDAEIQWEEEPLNLVTACLVLLNSVGRFDEALPLAERLHQSYAEHGADWLPSHQNALATIALVYGNCGRTDEAIGLLGTVRDNLEKRLSATHPALYSVRNNLAINLQNAGHFDDTVELLQQNLRYQTERYGPEACPTLATLATLGRVHFQQGDLAEAGAALTRARDAIVESCSDGLALPALHSYCLYADAVGDHAEAIRWNRILLKARLENRPPRSKEIGQVHLNLALSSLKHAMSLPAAERSELLSAAADSAVEGQKILGPWTEAKARAGDVDAGKSEHTLVITLFLAGRHERAADEAVRLVDLWRGSDGVPVKSIRDAQDIATKSLEALELYDQAANVGEEHLADLIADGVPEGERLQASHRVASLRFRTGDLEGARRLHEENLKVATRTLDPGAKGIQSLRRHLAKALHALGEHQQAGGLLRLAADGYRALALEGEVDDTQQLIDRCDACTEGARH